MCHYCRQDSGARRQDISDRGPYQSPAECGQVSCGGVAFASKGQYSRAQSARESFRLSTLILEASGAADAERPPKEGPARPGWNQIRSISFTCQFHLASLLACTKLASAQETNTLERDPSQRPICNSTSPFCFVIWVTSQAAAPTRTETACSTGRSREGLRS